MLDFVYFSGNAWVSCSLALIPYKLPTVKHCIYNFPCEMLTPLLNTYNTFPTSAGVLFSTKTLSPTYSSVSSLLFLPLTYMPVSEYCGTAPIPQNQPCSCSGVTVHLELFATPFCCCRKHGLAFLIFPLHKA